MASKWIREKVLAEATEYVALQCMAGMDRKIKAAPFLDPVVEKEKKERTARIVDSESNSDSEREVNSDDSEVERRRRKKKMKKRSTKRETLVPPMTPVSPPV